MRTTEPELKEFVQYWNRHNEMIRDLENGRNQTN
jgi:hypothetical protein